MLHRLILILLVSLFIFTNNLPGYAQSGEQLMEAEQLNARQAEQNADRIRLAVFGDSLAIDLSRALERLYADDPDLVVTSRGVSASGFVRDDYFDWGQAIREAIASNNFDLAVVMIGINDHQELQIGNVTYPPLSENWTTAYQARVRDFLEQLQAAHKPVIWMGLPPMPRRQYSAAMRQISDIQRLASFSGGANFLDIYERFANEDGDYSAYGPTVNGQNALMRQEDGIHFSAAGADKLAFYISQTIPDLYPDSFAPMPAADSLSTPDATILPHPTEQGIDTTWVLEAVGPIMPLSRTPPRASDLLKAGTSAAAPLAFPFDQLMNAPAGRVDTFDNKDAHAR